MVVTFALLPSEMYEIGGVYIQLPLRCGCSNIPLQWSGSPSPDEAPDGEILSPSWPRAVGDTPVATGGSCCRQNKASLLPPYK